jgi:hypothetical protein
MQNFERTHTNAKKSKINKIKINAIQKANEPA